MTHEPFSPAKIPQRKIWLWALYDFANSLAYVNVSFYFALWLVQEHKVSDIWISVPVALSTIILLFTLPAFGALSDRLRRRMPFLIIFTLLAITALFSLGIVAIKSPPLFTSSTLIFIVVLYFFFQYFYQASLAFYSSFIHDLAIGSTKEKLSGLGMAAGYLGNIVGLLLIFPISQGKLELFGATGREGTFLIASLLFFVFSLPVMLFLKDKRRDLAPKEAREKLGRPLMETLQTLRRIKQCPGALAYLITYCLFADAILTIQLFAALYLEKVGGLTDKQKTIAFVAGLILAAIGALSSPALARLLGGTRRTIAIFIALWALFITTLAFAANQHMLMTIIVLNGFVFGVLFSLSRAFYSYIIPPERQGEFFGVYVLFERFASILGPLLWSGTILAFASLGETTKYRLAMFSLALLAAASFFVFRSVKEPLTPSLENHQSSNLSDYRIPS